MHFSKSIALKSKLKFLPHSPVATEGGFGEFGPSEKNLQAPPKWNMKHYKTVMFVQISEYQAPLHKWEAPCIKHPPQLHKC